MRTVINICISLCRLPSNEERIVKVVAGKGNNLHQVEDNDGNSFLVSMPTKFR